MVEDQWREPRHVFRANWITLLAQLCQRCIHVERVPQHDDINDKPKRPKLILLPFPIPLAELSALAVEDCARASLCRSSLAESF